MRQLNSAAWLCATLLAVLMLLSCSTTEIQRAGKPGVGLDPKQGVYIVVPQDPADPDYAGSGKYLANTLAELIAKHGVGIGIGTENATPDENLAAAQKQGARYLIVPVITDWQHHYTDIGPIGKANSAGFTMTVITVTDGSTVRRDDLAKSGTHMSFMGGGDPKDQMKSAMEAYVDSLYPDN